jgi:hypothetical protein
MYKKVKVFEERQHGMIEERNAFVSELKEIKLECQRVQ